MSQGIEKGNTVTLAELAQRIGGEVAGDGSRPIDRMRPLDQAGERDLAFIDPKNARMVAALPEAKAGGVIFGRPLTLPAGKSGIRIDPPHLGLARALAVLHPRRRAAIGVSSSAHVGAGTRIGAGVNIHPGASVGDRTAIGDQTDILPGAVIGPDCVIGKECVIHPRAVIYQGVRIGDRVTIHAGAVIGADGFGYTPEPQPGNAAEPFRHLKIPQVGDVVIEDDVEIGANTTIDRATLASTVIGKGTKIDNLVMVAHNCTVGRHSVIIAQAGIAGSARIGNYVTIAGQAGMVGHINIGDRAIITAQAGVTKDVDAGQTVIGAPAMDLKEGRLAFGLIGRLPELKKSLADLQRRVERIEKERASS